MIVEQLLNDCYTFVERLLKDLKRLLKDCYRLVEQLYNYC